MDTRVIAMVFSIREKAPVAVSMPQE